MCYAGDVHYKGGMMGDYEKGVYIAIPNYRRVTVTGLSGWLFSLSAPPGESFYLDALPIQPVDCCRNELARRFLDDSALEWMFMVDDDIVPWPTVLDMRQRGHRIISAMTYITKRGVPMATLATRRRKNQVCIGGIPEGNLDPVEIVAVGTGALMLHRSVLEEINPPWFRFTYTRDGRAVQGEDFYFSKKARRAGYKIWVDPSCPCGHFHVSDIRENAALLMKALDCKDLDEFSQFFGLLDPKEEERRQKAEIFTIRTSGKGGKG